MVSNRWALYTARRSNQNWGYGNVVYRAGLRLGWEWVFDCDYRKESHTPAFSLSPEVNHLIMKGELFHPKSFQAIRGKIAFWYPDQVTGFPDRQRTLRELCPLAHHVFFMHLDEQHFYNELLPEEKITFLPTGCAPEYHRCRGGERTIPIGHVGNLNPASGRLKYLEAFRVAGLPIETPKLYGDAMMEFYSRCKIVWNLGWRRGGIQTRFWEAMGAGALVVTNETGGNTGSPFTPGVHLVTYHDEEDAIQKCRYFLEHEEERAAIVRAASSKLLEETIDKRLLTIQEKMR